MLLVHLTYLIRVFAFRMNEAWRPFECAAKTLIRDVQANLGLPVYWFYHAAVLETHSRFTDLRVVITSPFCYTE